MEKHEPLFRAAEHGNDSEDGGDAPMPQAFAVSGKPDFSTGPPASAEEYLKRVRYEASQCAQVVVATNLEDLRGRPPQVCFGFLFCLSAIFYLPCPSNPPPSSLLPSYLHYCRPASCLIYKHPRRVQKIFFRERSGKTTLQPTFQSFEW